MPDWTELKIKIKVDHLQELLNCQKNKTNNKNNLATVPFTRHNNYKTTVVAHSKA